MDVLRDGIMKISIITAIISNSEYNDVVRLANQMAESRGIIEMIIVVGKDKSLYDRLHKQLSWRGIKVIFNPGHYSLSNQRNHGIPFATGNVLAFLDSDVLPSQGWSNAVLESFAEPAVVGVTGPVIPKWPDKKQLIPPEIDWVVSCTSWVRFSHLQSIPWAWGGNMIFRREIFDSGLRFNNDLGFGSSRFALGADVDFSIRAKKCSGGKIIWNSYVKVLHMMKPFRVNVLYIFRRAFSVGYTQGFVHLADPIGKVNMEAMALKSLLSGIIGVRNIWKSAGFRNGVKIPVIYEAVGVGLVLGRLFASTSTVVK
jgi:glycosyltransferase involved in cell wall biosynthesis